MGDGDTNTVSKLCSAGPNAAKAVAKSEELAKTELLKKYLQATLKMPMSV